MALRVKSPPRRQSGIALVVILALLGIIAGVLAVQLFSRADLENQKNKKTTAALAQAKAALIGYAIAYPDTHADAVPSGYLPCPDQAGVEGSAEPNCGARDISQLGRLPWKTLGLPALRDGSGECLWYAVSGTYKNNIKTSKRMNWDLNGLFQVLAADGTTLAGQTADSQAVAVVFAPGTPRANQDRAADGSAPICGGNYNAANYLDAEDAVDNATVSGTANAVSQFRAGNTAQINDRIIYITKEDIFNALRSRLQYMTLKTAECIADFGRKNGKPASNPSANKSLPWPAPLSLANYETNDNYDDQQDRYAGRVPYRVDTSRNKTDNTIGNDNLLQADGANCPASANWGTVYPWWNHWKDHLFYALGQEFKPDDEATDNCGNCLEINGSGNYAAVVIFAGQKLSALNQTRADKSIIADYLEGRNSANYASAHGDENYQTGVASSTFNDILYCIREDLSVTPCP